MQCRDFWGRRTLGEAAVADTGQRAFVKTRRTLSTNDQSCRKPRGLESHCVPGSAPCGDTPARR